jgi:hypothetical protein
LTGPLLSADKQTITTTQSPPSSFPPFLNIVDGATLTGNSTNALVQFSNGSSLSTAQFLCVSCFMGSTAATVNLKGSLLNSSNSTLTLLLNLAGIQNGGTLVTQAPTSGAYPLVSFNGGTLSVSSSAQSVFHAFDLPGTATANEVVEGNTLTLGTAQPLQHGGGGALFETSGTTINSENRQLEAVFLDTALLQATAPLIHLMASSTMTSNGDLVNLTQNAKLSANLPGDALIKLNASTLNVTKGSLFNVAGGSFLNVNGNLFSLTNGSTLNISNGGIATVSGGSVFTLTGGSLGTFGAGTNTHNLTNNICSSNCNIFNPVAGLPVLLVNGAVSGNVSVNQTFTPLAGLGGNNTSNLSGSSPALVVVDGPTSKVKLGF